jgi:hypothetical protein
MQTLIDHQRQQRRPEPINPLQEWSKLLDLKRPQVYAPMLDDRGAGGLQHPMQLGRP